VLPTILLIVGSFTCTFRTAAKTVTLCIRRLTIAHHRQQAKSADRREIESRRIQPKHARKRQAVRRLGRPSPEPYSNSIREFRLAVALLGTVDLPTPLRESAGIRPAAYPWRLRACGVSGSTSASKYLWNGAFPFTEKEWRSPPTPSKTMALEHCSVGRARMAEGVHLGGIVPVLDNATRTGSNGTPSTRWRLAGQRQAPSVSSSLSKGDQV